MTKAYELGMEHGHNSDYMSRARRREILAAAGLEISMVCEEFERGRAAGIASRKASESTESSDLDAARERVERMRAGELERIDRVETARFGRPVRELRGDELLSARRAESVTTESLDEIEKSLGIS